MSDLIRRDEAVEVINRMLGDVAEPVVIEINCLTGYVAKTPTNTSTDLISRERLLKAWNDLLCRSDFPITPADVTCLIKKVPSADRPTSKQPNLYDNIVQLLRDFDIHEEPYIYDLAEHICQLFKDAYTK